MLITKIYKKGVGQKNEDAYTINQQTRLYAVMDGATGLDGIPGHIASYAVSKEFERTDNALSLIELSKQANERVKEANENDGQFGKFHDIPKAKRSSTGLAALQFNEDHTSFDYVHAGDCMIFLQYKDGTIRTITHDHIHALDQEVIRIIAQLQKKRPVQFEEMREQTLPLLIENRTKMNCDDGYGIIDGSEEAMHYLEHGTIMAHKLSQILLMSDGLQMPVESEEENPWENAATIAFTQGLPALLDTVNEKEHADPNGIRYPRFKFADDKTAILIQLDRST